MEKFQIIWLLMKPADQDPHNESVLIMKLQHYIDTYRNFIKWKQHKKLLMCTCWEYVHLIGYIYSTLLILLLTYNYIGVSSKKLQLHDLSKVINSIQFHIV